MAKKILLALLPLLTAALLILSYPGFDQGWLAWAALAPLAWHILDSKTLKAALAGGFLWLVSPQLNFICAFVCGLAGTAYFLAYCEE